MTEKYWKDFILELTESMRQRILQFFGRPDSRSISGKSIGGDSTFFIDDISETFLSRYLEDRNLDIAYYSEDKGLVKYGSPEKLLIVDPIDGTRAAAAGLESSCISIALSSFAENPRIKDLELGCVQEIKSGRIFIAEKDRGAGIIYKGKAYPPSLSKNTDISSLFWSVGLRGRPVVPIIEILEELIDNSNFNGSVFYLGSASFSITRVVSGQLDCYIDIGHRLVSEFPVLEKNYTKVGQGSIINNYPYDIAAGYIILRESGGFITDASGNSLEERPLMGIGRDFQLSIVASSNEELHSILLMMIDRGFNKLEDNLGRY
jgi:myo-inositol-1(or 4)-monophosphatase